MKIEKISLDESCPEAYLTIYDPDSVGPQKYDAMLVIPGGGYSCVCADREGEPIALAYLAQGMKSFVLHYSVKEKAVFPRPLAQASRAVAWIREHAEEYHIDPDRIFACGFSAGGHLCAALGTMWHLPEVWQAAGIPEGSNKIAGMVPVYAVISTGVSTHEASFYNILGTEHPTQEQLALYSLENRVDEHTAPTYLVHTSEDPVVPIENCLVFAMALAKNKIPFETHIYQKGPHGMALANEITDMGMPAFDNSAMAEWVANSRVWMKGLKNQA